MKETDWHTRLNDYLPDKKVFAEKEKTVPEKNRSGISRKRLGTMPVQDVLDLHGLIIQDAEFELDVFMKSCRKRRIRKVLIIHGKGLHSDGGPKLKKFVIEYLSGHPDVLEYNQADLRQGGAGATWVILRD